MGPPCPRCPSPAAQARSWCSGQGQQRAVRRRLPRPGATTDVRHRAGAGGTTAQLRPCAREAARAGTFVDWSSHSVSAASRTSALIPGWSGPAIQNIGALWRRSRRLDHCVEAGTGCPAAASGRPRRMRVRLSRQHLKPTRSAGSSPQSSSACRAARRCSSIMRACGRTDAMGASAPSAPQVARRCAGCGGASSGPGGDRQRRQLLQEPGRGCVAGRPVAHRAPRPARPPADAGHRKLSGLAHRALRLARPSRRRCRHLRPACAGAGQPRSCERRATARACASRRAIGRGAVRRATRTRAAYRRRPF